LEFRAVRRMIERLPAGIYRAKGFVYLDKPAERRGVLQVVGNRVRFTFGEAWGHESPATNVVLIGEPGALKPEELTQRFAACLPGATSRAQEIISDVVEWVRSF
jgi:G3E family GTPase